jgi:hypothetical protein
VEFTFRKCNADKICPKMKIILKILKILVHDEVYYVHDNDIKMMMMTTMKTTTMTKTAATTMIKIII